MLYRLFLQLGVHKTTLINQIVCTDLHWGAEVNDRVCGRDHYPFHGIDNVKKTTVWVYKRLLIQKMCLPIWHIMNVYNVEFYYWRMRLLGARCMGGLFVDFNLRMYIFEICRHWSRKNNNGLTVIWRNNESMVQLPSHTPLYRSCLLDNLSHITFLTPTMCLAVSLKPCTVANQNSSRLYVMNTGFVDMSLLMQ